MVVVTGGSHADVASPSSPVNDSSAVAGTGLHMDGAWSAAAAF